MSDTLFPVVPRRCPLTSGPGVSGPNRDGIPQTFMYRGRTPRTPLHRRGSRISSPKTQNPRVEPSTAGSLPETPLVTLSTLTSVSFFPLSLVNSVHLPFAPLPHGTPRLHNGVDGRREEWCASTGGRRRPTPRRRGAGVSSSGCTVTAGGKRAGRASPSHGTRPVPNPDEGSGRAEGGEAPGGHGLLRVEERRLRPMGPQPRAPRVVGGAGKAEQFLVLGSQASRLDVTSRCPGPRRTQGVGPRGVRRGRPRGGPDTRSVHHICTWGRVASQRRGCRR